MHGNVIDAAAMQTCMAMETRLSHSKLMVLTRVCHR
jgi:hypothetical protein